MPVKLGGSGGGGGQVTEISATADGAIANGAPCIQSGDGKIATPVGNIAANAIDVGSNTSSNNNSAYYAFYNGITFVDRAAGRGILLGNQGVGYNYRATCKLFTVNTSTGGGTASGMTSTNFSYPQGTGVNYTQYPVGAIWDADTDSWFGCYRFNSSASYGLNMFKHRTTNGTTSTAGYGHTFGTTNYWNPYSSQSVGSTRFIEARGFKYVITTGSTQAYGRDSCMVHGPFTWTSNAHDGGAFGAHVVATDYVANGYNYTADASYDSANEQIVVVTANYNAGAHNQTLYAFDVAANGTVTYSHYLANAGGADVIGQIRAVECDTAGNIVWSELTAKKFYAASNNGSAFTKGGSLAWPAGVHSQISMRYSSTYKNFVASFCPANFSALPPPKHIIFAVGAGNFSDKTFTSAGTGSTYGTYGNYAGYQDYPTSSAKIGGNFADTTDTFIQYNFGNADGNTVSEVNSNKIATSNLFTGNYIGLAKAAISNGASGTLTTKGAINESQSGLTAGARYAVTPTGTVKTESSLTDAEQLSSVFLGTATATNAIIVGDSLVAVDSSAIHNDVPKGVATSGSSTPAAYSTDGWTSVLNRFGINTSSVTATGTNTILKVTGSGTVLYFILGGQSQQSTSVTVHIDGVQIIESGTITTGNSYPYCPIGEFGGVNSNKHGNFSPSTAFSFNKSFEVKNNGGTATAFYIGYRIVEN